MPLYVGGFLLPIPKKHAKSYRSQAQKAGKVNAQVMKDPRLLKMMEKMNTRAMPFDVKRMAYGGFEVLVDA